MDDFDLPKDGYASDEEILTAKVWWRMLSPIQRLEIGLSDLTDKWAHQPFITPKKYREQNKTDIDTLGMGIDRVVWYYRHWVNK